MKKIITINSIISPIITYKFHSHEHWELIYYTSGEGSITVNNITYSFDSGTIIIIPPYTLHTDIAQHGFTNLYVIFDNTEFPLETFTVHDNPSRDVYTLLLLLHREFLLQQNSHEPILTSLLDTIFSYLNIFLMSNKTNIYVEQMKQIISERFANPDFSPKELYAVLDINGDYARRLFVKELGITPIHFLRELRIRKAKDMLCSSDTDLTINEIASQCGFSDQYRFSKVFKEVMGVSPSAWQQKERDCFSIF